MVPLALPGPSAPSLEGVNKCDHTNMGCMHAYTAPARSMPRGADVLLFAVFSNSVPLNLPGPSAPSPEGVNECDHTDMECIHAYTAPARSMPRGADGWSLLF